MTRARPGGRPLLLCLLGCLALGACRERVLTLTTGAVLDAGADRRWDASSVTDLGATDGGVVPPDAAQDAEPEGPCSPNLDEDPANCGSCGHVCQVPGAVAKCSGGLCAIDACLPGFLDLNGGGGDGCEYACTVTQAGSEICDDVDNDCDGMVDEDTDKMGDVSNCGACDHQCAFLHAGASCQQGSCVRGACTAGFVDANGMGADGCECAVSNGGTEICDGIDNDCDGALDDVPAAGLTDDPQHCGACNRNCTTLPHATATCSGAACVILSCAFGWTDGNQQASDGCENACAGGWPGGIEVCDGADNDCDGKVDAADDSLVAIANFCAQRGECAGSQPVCTGGRWTCNYAATVELSAPNQIIGNETRCDGKDNDCDGCVDETFPQVGLAPSASGGSCTATAAQSCRDTGVGVCQGQGHAVCNAQQNGVTCLVTTPGAAPAAEICDGQDNNCDGVVDNGSAADPARVREPMVAVSGGGLAATVYVYAYEASRPDATATSAGSSAARACARAGSLPWTNLTRAEAQAACAAAGKRLCTEAEWQRACQTAAGASCTWSYAGACTTAAPSLCNTHELDGDAAMSGDQDVLRATGSLASCYADWGAAGHIFDLTGNAKEWTAPRSAGVNPLRGGSYNDLLGGSTCTFNFVAVGDGYKLANAGFRCCSDTAP